MIFLLVGHRGSGKTQFLNRVAAYLPEARTVDLDQEIVRAQGRTIDEIFASEGEDAFRRIERSTLHRIVKAAPKDQDLFVSLGAGYTGELPTAVRILWVRRLTDSQPRVFLDRPRLNGAVSPVEEYRERFASREAKYEAIAHEIWTVPEGMDRSNSIEERFVHSLIGRAELDVGGIVTLLPAHFRYFEAWVKTKLGWGSLFEIRDDLLSADQVREAAKWIPAGRILYSFRTGGAQLTDAAHVDWPVELGDQPKGSPTIFSLHERRPGESVRDSAGRLQNVGKDVWLKLAVEVHDFDELMQGYLWAEEDPKRRSFLPRSSDGRWAWFRAWTQNRYPISFWREGNGSALDQPALADWVRMRGSAATFAAVLGDPVAHSRSPAEHTEFFAARGMPFFAIRLTPEEWRAGAIDGLKKLGLRAAAVTAPLKDLAGEISGAGVAMNTLAWSEDRWISTGTDALGLAEVAREMTDRGAVAVWGGGGTLGSVHDVFPEASFYSARTAEPRPGSRSIEDPRTVIWAVGRKSGLQEPPSSWKPREVLDLNYSENSPGREFALKTGARYTSGLKMFEAQARAQREFWSQS